MMYCQISGTAKVKGECHNKPELKDMSLKIQRAHIEPHIRKEERSTPRLELL